MNVHRRIFWGCVLLVAGLVMVQVVSWTVLLPSALALPGHTKGPFPPQLPGVPGNLHVKYDVEMASPVIPRATAEAWIAALEKQGEPDTSTIEYLKYKESSHPALKSTREYWVNDKSSFCWYDRSWCFSDGQTFRFLTISNTQSIDLKAEPPIYSGSLDIFSVTGRPGLWGVDLDHVPLLGFQQPLKTEYFPGKDYRVQKTQEGILQIYETPHPYDPQPLHCRALYDTLGRLIRLKIDDDIYEYRQFQKLGNGAFIPREVVIKHEDVLSIKGKQYPFLINLITYKVISLETDDALAQKFPFPQVPAGVEVLDNRYMSDSSPLRYRFLGEGTVDEASLQRANAQKAALGHSP